MGKNGRDRRKHQMQKSEASVAEEPSSLSVQECTPSVEGLGRNKSLALESSSHLPVLVRRM